MSNMWAKRLLITGRANAGKTLFMLNFVEYMGYNEITIKFKNRIEELIKTCSIESFKKTIVSDVLNTTKCLQISSIMIPVLKGKKSIEFTDSTGISSSIHFDQEIRDGMVQTLSLLREDYIIIHVIDAAMVSMENKIDDIDMELYKYCKKRGNYLILANKIDIKQSEPGLNIINNLFQDVRVIKISALYKTGFAEVKKYVSKVA